MAVKRIVTNIAANNLALATSFYHDILELDLVMDQGWIRTYASVQSHNCQISIASEGGSGTSVPDISIEVDNIEVVCERMQVAGFNVVYPLTLEPWGIRRFYVEDPFGKLINILEHMEN